MSSTRTRDALAAGFPCAAVLWGGPAWAASPSQQECEAAGGTFSRDQGTVTCTFETSDPVGNSESSGGKSQTRDTTTTDGGQGNLKNKETQDSTCTGPGNSQNC